MSHQRRPIAYFLLTAVLILCFDGGKSRGAETGRPGDDQFVFNGVGSARWKENMDRALERANPRVASTNLTPRRPPRRNPDLQIQIDPNKARAVTYHSIKAPGPFIAMTYDDGPHPKNTPRLLDMLRERNIKATFYVVGTNARRYPSLLKRMIAEGHEIGNHSVSHPNLTNLSNKNLRRELQGCHDAIVDACGVAPLTMRPPGGSLSNRQRVWIHEEFNYPTILWNVDPKDYKRPGISVVASRILSATRNGSIVLTHDLHAPTVSAMPQTLDGLLDKGFKFLTVSQLIAMDGMGEVATPNVSQTPPQEPTPLLPIENGASVP